MVQDEAKVDGDGHDDFLIGAFGNCEGGWQAGQTYLFLGTPKSAPKPPTIPEEKVPILSQRVIIRNDRRLCRSSGLVWKGTPSGQGQRLEARHLQDSGRGGHLLFGDSLSSLIRSR